MKTAIQKLVGLSGYALVNQRLPASPVTPLDTATDAIYQQTDIVFEVPISKCQHPYLFSYGPECWNPFVETCRQFGSGRHTTYEGSVLQHYYEVFQPKTHLDMWLGDVEQDEILGRSRLRELTADTYPPMLPWDPTPIPLKKEKGLDASHGSQGYGPVSDAKGRLEFTRLTGTYDSIKRKGYRPSGAADGEIRGFFVRQPGDYRFVIRAGLHRTAALSALGATAIRVKFTAHYPRTIDVADLENWPPVKSGFLEPHVARTIFLRFFENDGDERARRIGLLPSESAPWRPR